MQNKNLIKWATGVALFLIIPLWLTLINPTATINGGSGGGWDWTFFDFVFAFVVLFGAGATYEIVARKMTNKTYKAAVGIAVLTSLVLIWINAAVGIIGDDEWPNFLYLGVLAFGFISAIVFRFKASKLMKILFAMAALQMLVPITALFIANEQMQQTPGVLGVFGLTSVFAILFLVSGMLFRNVSKIEPKQV